MCHVRFSFLKRDQASYSLETRDGLCYVTIQNTAVELVLLSLGGMLIELTSVVRKAETARGRLDLTSKSVSLFVAFVSHGCC